MNFMSSLKQTLQGAVLVCTLLGIPASLAGQTQIAPKSAGTSTPNGQSFSNEQLLPLTVHQAWLLSGKNEATFFQMVTQLADFSAKNREVTLPETEAAGRRVGEIIKAAARTDTDQLLYAVVDSAVRRVTKAAPIPAGTRKTNQ